MSVTAAPALWVFLLLAQAGGGGSAPSVRAEPAQEVTVFAAASLREVFQDLAKTYEASHPNVRVRLSLAGSQELRTQIQQGAPADVFASADTKSMDALLKTGLVARPRIFARNQLVVVVPRENPAGLRSFADLPQAKRLVIAAPEVPAGAYLVQTLDRTGPMLGNDFKARVLGRVVSRELNVRQVLAKVILGEADAGVVYQTDAAAAADKVSTISVPASLTVQAEYPAAVVTASKQAAKAASFIDLLLSAPGRRRLLAAGFLVPASADAGP